MRKKIAELGKKAKDKIAAADFGQTLKDHAKQVSAWAAVLDQKELLRWMNELKFPKSRTDEIMDGAYNNNHVGGNNHRLFDGGHTLAQAWEAAKNASPDDTFAQEVIAFAKALWNDGSTVKGLPFRTLDPSNYNEWVEKITATIPGISKEWLFDLQNYDAIELTSTIVGAVGAIFMMNRDDKEKFGEIVGSMGISSIAGANPVMMVATICLVGFSYVKKKQELDKGAIGKGAALTGISSLLFAILGFPFLIELIVVMVVTRLVRKKVIENEEIMAVIKHHLKAGRAKGLELVHQGLTALLEKIDKARKVA